MTLGTLADRLSQYDKREAHSIVRLLLAQCYGMTLADIYSGALDDMDADTRNDLEARLLRLQDGEPVQYVTGKADFFGREFLVRPGCLIPRPETEELCEWIVALGNDAKDILDIGTGSGCIAVTLARELPHSHVTAWDISDDALAIARENAIVHSAKVCFQKRDALNLSQQPTSSNILPSSTHPTPLKTWDIIVSNPPYICDREADEMERNVLDHEPRQALFVPDNAPLLFYRNITKYAISSLRRNGLLFFEINSAYGAETVKLLENHGFTDVELRKDAFGNDRISKGRKGDTL